MDKMIGLSLIAASILVLYLLTSIKILNEYDRGVLFRPGQVLPIATGPRVALVFAPIDRIARMSPRRSS